MSTWGGVHRSAFLALGHGADRNIEVRQRARLVPGIGNAVHVAAGGTRDGAASSLVVLADGAVLAASNEPNIFSAGAASYRGHLLGRFFELRPAIP